jgi:ABC-type Fe3+-hydroxamate transport system substrate-binding protein
MGVSPIRVDGAGSVIDAWIQAAGGINAAHGVFGLVSTVSIEQVLKWNPDVIIVGTTEIPADITCKSCTNWPKLCAPAVTSYSTRRPRNSM